MTKRKKLRFGLEVHLGSIDFADNILNWKFQYLIALSRRCSTRRCAAPPELRFERKLSSTVATSTLALSADLTRVAGVAGVAGAADLRREHGRSAWDRLTRVGLGRANDRALAKPAYRAASRCRRPSSRSSRRSASMRHPRRCTRQPRATCCPSRPP